MKWPRDLEMRASFQGLIDHHGLTARDLVTVFHGTPWDTAGDGFAVTFCQARNEVGNEVVYPFKRVFSEIESEPESEPTDILLAMQDPRWVDVHHGGTGCSTIGAMGCWLCCCAMAQRLLGIDASATPITADAIVGPEGYADCSMRWDVMWKLGLGVVESVENQASIKAHLDAGGVSFADVYIGATKHFVMVAEHKAGRLWMYDPLKAVGGWLDEYYPWGAESYRLVCRVEPKPEPVIGSVVGVHGAPVTHPPQDPAYWLTQLRELGVVFFKTLCLEPDWIAQLLDAGIEVILRPYQGEQLPGRLAPDLMERVCGLIELGAYRIEVANEPNIDVEYKVEVRSLVDWHNDNLVAQVAESWWADASEIAEAGGRPALPAMAPTDSWGNVNERYSSVMWLRKIVSYLDDRYGSSLRERLASGQIWLATHSGAFDRPIDFDPWQFGEPDDMCLRGYEAAMETVRRYTGVVPVTVSTEGGVYSPEHLEFLGWGTYSEQEYASRTVEMFDWLQASGGLMAICPWTLTDEDTFDKRWLDNGWFRGRTPRLVAKAMRDREAAR